MLAGGAFVQIATRDTVGIEDVALGTRTGETALGILAGEFARRRCQFAFIYIYNQVSISLISFENF